MGVADITLSQAITQQLNQQELSIANLEEQVSSGRSLNKPSDNPAAVTQVLQLSSQASQLSNWQANAQTASSWLGMGNNALNSVLDDMQSARTLILQTLNQGTQNATTYQAAGQQLQGINADLLSTSTLNTRAAPFSPARRPRVRPMTPRATTWATVTRPMSSSAPDPAPVRRRPSPCPVHRSSAPAPPASLTTLTTVIGQLGSGTPTATQLNAALTALDANISTAEQASAVLGNGSDQVGGGLSLAHQPAHIRAEHAGRVGGRERGDGHDAARLGDDQLSGRHVGRVPGHPRDVGAFPVRRTDTAPQDGSPL